MKSASKLIIFLLLLSLFPTSLYAADKSNTVMTTQSNKTFVRINDYYLIYTYPQAPFIDQNRRFMVPLRAVGDLMSAEVSYDASSKKAGLKFAEHSVSVTIGSKKAEIDGSLVQMDTVPQLIKQSVYVPLRILIQGFKLEVNTTIPNVIWLEDER
ncbi:copper amine oxidase N-terminal domain-containing protein [Paenibacillus arenilitoris]|uniref:Copper amine oxidase N-terminal domain-containing protein n=1 Tax=Paenibacillus arenilitoris TaxID=2772299 RepID=A0A927CRH7_9BACL|nr:copper amine oxidase N-terminal domain-containing protein [Paenibacillus arenilitoris]MBD2870891.1 copper amine oxidase N-terminal domain-containing protein [Paenibacillus arenilitoris]